MYKKEEICVTLSQSVPRIEEFSTHNMGIFECKPTQALAIEAIRGTKNLLFNEHILWVTLSLGQVRSDLVFCSSVAIENLAIPMILYDIMGIWYLL